MNGAIAGRRTAPRLPAAVLGLIVAVSLALGWIISGPADLEPKMQVAVPLGAVMLTFGLAVWLRRPELVLGLLAFSLPLLESSALVGGLNAGELAMLSVATIGFVSLVRVTSPGHPDLHRLILPLLGLAVLGGIAAAANGATSPSDLAASAFKPLIWAILLYLVFLHFDSSTKLHALILAMIASAAAVGLYTMFEYAGGQASQAYFGGPTRASGTFEHWNQLGGFMALMAFPTLGYALVTKRRVARLALLSAFAIEIIALMLSLTVGSMLALFVAGLFGLIPLARRRPTIALLLALLPVAVLGLSGAVFPAVLERFEIAGERANDRLATYYAGIGLARDNFWLGTGSIEKATQEIRQTTEYRFTPFAETSSQPHNAFLSTWVEKGVFGFVLLAVLAWFSLKLLLAAKPPPDDPMQLAYWGVLFGGVAFLLQNFSNNLLTNARQGIIFLFLVLATARLGHLRRAAADATGEPAGGGRTAGAAPPRPATAAARA